ncbi:MAG: hypothetical protein AAFN78_07960 [Pseudomonadota bacterium]
MNDSSAVVRLAVVVCAAWLAMSSPAGAQTLSVSDGRPSAIIEIELPAAGEYRLVVEDLEFPVAFAGLSIAVADDVLLLATLEEPGEASFEATDTSVTLLVFAQPAAPNVVGTVSVSVVDPQDESVVFGYLDSLEQEQPDGPAVAGAYEFSLDSEQAVSIAVQDLSIPRAMDSLDALVLDAQSGEVTRLNGSSSDELTLPAGDYRVFSSAQASPDADDGDESEAGNGGDGAYRIDVQAQAQPLLADVVVVGDAVQRQLVSLPGGDAYLSGFDVGFPSPLAALQGVLTGAGASLAVDQDNPRAEGELAEGDYVLLVYAEADPATSGGSYVVDTGTDAGSVSSFADLVTPPTEDAGSSRIAAEFDVGQAGTVTVTVTDFAFPAALSALNTAIVGPAGLAGSLVAAGTVDVEVEPGTYRVLVSATPSAGQSGLYGVVARDAAGASLIETVNAAPEGGAFGTISAAEGERVTVTLTDVGFPANFSSLALAVTRGAETTGFIFGEGSFFFDATEASDYTYSLLAQVDEETGGGIYNLDISKADTPPPETPEPPPTVTPPPPVGDSGGGGAGGALALLALLSLGRLRWGRFRAQ